MDLPTGLQWRWKINHLEIIEEVFTDYVRIAPTWSDRKARRGPQWGICAKRIANAKFNHFKINDEVFAHCVRIAPTRSDHKVGRATQCCSRDGKHDGPMPLPLGGAFHFTFLVII